MQLQALPALVAMPSSVDYALTVDTEVATFPSLALDCGVTLKDVQVAYETYGSLNAERTNAILILHAFSGMRMRRESVARQVSRDGGRR